MLQVPTDQRWLEVALSDMDSVLLDHAHCEKKAAASALSLIASYPDHAQLVQRMARLAQEELQHFRQVYDRLLARGLVLRRDAGDPYARALRTHLRRNDPERLTDLLLVAALIEARSCERLELLAGGLQDAELAAFYGTLARAEAGHSRLFVDLAREHDPAAEARLTVLAAAEADVTRGLPLEARIH